MPAVVTKCFLPNENDSCFSDVEAINKTVFV